MYDENAGLGENYTEKFYNLLPSDQAVLTRRIITCGSYERE